MKFSKSQITGACVILAMMLAFLLLRIYVF